MAPLSGTDFLQPEDGTADEARRGLRSASAERKNHADLKPQSEQPKSHYGDADGQSRKSEQDPGSMRRVPPNALRFSCGPMPAATQMNLFLWLHARQLQAPG